MVPRRCNVRRDLETNLAPIEELIDFLVKVFLVFDRLDAAVAHFNIAVLLNDEAADDIRLVVLLDTGYLLVRRVRRAAQLASIRLQHRIVVIRRVHLQHCAAGLRHSLVVLGDIRRAASTAAIDMRHFLISLAHPAANVLRLGDHLAQTSLRSVESNLADLDLGDLVLLDG